MRLTCPLCGIRDRREFTYQGAALGRPGADDGAEAWDDYLHNRDNQPGPQEEFWYHDPCGAWAVITRDTRDHAVLGSREPGA